MNVLINGGGNIGTTLCNIIHVYRELLGVNQIFLKKNSSKPWQEADLEILKELGVNIIAKEAKLMDLLPSINYVFDATSNTSGLKNKEIYKQFKHLKGVAQGSEKGFGIPFISGLNNEKTKGQQFVQVVSCNTHGAASILQALSGNNFNTIHSADFVVVRRSEDIGNHERLVTANVVARHLDDTIGTHHAIDLTDTLKTIDVNIPITSSDITTPSQLMHSTRFNIELTEPLNQKELLRRINDSEFLAQTIKFDSNLIFELGRRYGMQGRIYNHAIIVSNNIMIEGNTIKGWAFVPQEGNTILSTIHAFLLQTNHLDEVSVIKQIKSELLQQKW